MHHNHLKIEKETLSIVFGVERFHNYLYGWKLTVINDHQPLKSIIGKSDVIWLPHIHKFFLYLNKYEFDLKYSPGETMLVSDALSQTYIKNSNLEFDENSLIYQLFYSLQAITQWKLFYLSRANWQWKLFYSSCAIWKWKLVDSTNAF